MTALIDQHCQPLEPGTKPLSATALRASLADLSGWKADSTGTALERDLEFKSFPLAIGFVNHVGAVAEREKHHPTIEVRWTKVHLSLTSRDVGGVSQNDLILAAKISALA